MARSKRNAPPTPRPRKPKTAQLRPRTSGSKSHQDLVEPQQKPVEPPAKKVCKRTPNKKKQQKPFRLMDLAPELRILVYEVSAMRTIRSHEN